MRALSNRKLVVLGMDDRGVMMYDCRGKVCRRLQECEGVSDEEENYRGGNREVCTWLSALLRCCRDAEVESEDSESSSALPHQGAVTSMAPSAYGRGTKVDGKGRGFADTSTG